MKVAMAVRKLEWVHHCSARAITNIIENRNLKSAQQQKTN
jgi:hypothetical protein